MKRNPSRPICPAEGDRIIDLYRSGTNFAAIAQAVGRTRQGVHRYLIRVGEHKPNRRAREYRTSDRERVFAEFKRTGLIYHSAAVAGVGRAAAHAWIIAAGLHEPEPKRTMTTAEIAEIRRLRFEEKFTIRTIARIMDCSKTTVHKYTRPDNAD